VHPGGPDALELVDLPVPVPGAGQVRIPAEAFGVGTPDVLIRRGVYKWMPPLPANPRNDLAGRISAVGPGVPGIEVGMKVLLQGCVHPRAPRSVVVVGAAGGVGTALVQLAKRAGMTVIGTVSSDEKAAFARGNGVDHVVFYRTEAVVPRVLELTGGAGVGAVFDHAGGPGFVPWVGALGHWGALVSYNGFAPLPEQNLVAALREHMAVCPSVRSFSFHLYDHDAPARRALMRQVIDALSRGEIRPAISARLPLAQVRRAHEQLERRSALGKIVMTP